MSTIAILVAAGRGERLGAARPKAFLELGGRSLLERSAAAFEAAAGVDGVVAVVPAEQAEEARRLLAACARLRAVVPGGERRQDSVQAGLAAAQAGPDDVVLIHDAARPFVEPALIESVAAAAREHGAALPVLALVDTVKRVRDGRVLETLDRDELFGAQTPQGFRLGLLRQALAAAAARGLTLTDECLAVELDGQAVRAVPGSERNRKITTPADLEWARALLAGEAA